MARPSCMGSSRPFTCTARSMAPRPILPAAIRLPSASSCPEPLAPDHFFQHLQHGERVAEPEFDAFRVFRGDEPLFETFHREGEGDPRGDRVHAETVADLVRLADRPHIRHPAVGPESGDGLVLRAAVNRVHGEIWVVDPDLFLAADRTGVTSFHADPIFRHEGLRRDLLHVVETAVLEVETGQDPGEAEALHDLPGSRFPEGGHFFEILPHQSGQFTHAFRFRHGRKNGTAGRDGFQFFRPHYRAESRSPGRVGQIVHDRGETDEVLTGGADRRGADQRVLKFAADLLLGFLQLFPPQAARRRAAPLSRP